jgi:HD superfamily phosphodiesterase
MVENKELAFLLAYEDDAKIEAIKILESLPNNLRYHVSSHTLDYVYPESVKLSKLEGLNDDSRLIIAVSALFHDTGFTNQYQANEPIGAKNAFDYTFHSLNQVLIDNSVLIHKAIENTNMQNRPRNIVQKIIRDADLSVMGKPEFLEWNDKLREEILLHPESGMYQFATDNQRWAQSQLKFLLDHKWFTNAALKTYEIQKIKNIGAFRRKYNII